MNSTRTEQGAGWPFSNSRLRPTRLQYACMYVCVCPWLPAALHQTQLLDGTAADAVLHVIRKIALQHPHRIPFVVGHRVGHQLTGLTAVNRLKVSLRKRGVRVPAIHLRVALVPEEYRRAIVSSDNDHTAGFLAKICGSHRVSKSFHFISKQTHLESVHRPLRYAGTRTSGRRACWCSGRWSRALWSRSRGESGLYRARPGNGIRRWRPLAAPPWTRGPPADCRRWWPDWRHHWRRRSSRHRGRSPPPGTAGESCSRSDPPETLSSAPCRSWRTWPPLSGGTFGPGSPGYWLCLYPGPRAPRSGPPPGPLQTAAPCSCPPPAGPSMDTAWRWWSRCPAWRWSSPKWPERPFGIGAGPGKWYPRSAGPWWRSRSWVWTCRSSWRATWCWRRGTRTGHPSTGWAGRRSGRGPGSTART